MDYGFKPEEIIINLWGRNRKAGSWSYLWPIGIRVIHLPTGIVVTCDSERSQHANRHIALIELQQKVKEKAAN